ncbi:MAG: hypothetical protein ACJAZ0_002515 [Halioglobus sp.]|jgi:hypothetical protein
MSSLGRYFQASVLASSYPLHRLPSTYTQKGLYIYLVGNPVENTGISVELSRE